MPMELRLLIISAFTPSMLARSEGSQTTADGRESCQTQEALYAYQPITELAQQWPF